MARAMSTVVLSTVTMGLPLPSAERSILSTMRLTGSAADIAGKFISACPHLAFRLALRVWASSQEGRLMVNELRLNGHRIHPGSPLLRGRPILLSGPRTRAPVDPTTGVAARPPTSIAVGLDKEPDSPERDAFSMSTWKEPSQPHAGMEA